MRERVRALLEAGLSIGEIARELERSPATICYHARRLGYPPKPRRRYDWDAIQTYYDAGHSYRECRERFGFSAGAWAKAAERRCIRPRRNITALATWLVTGGTVNRQHLKRRLVEAGLKDDRCEECGISDWRGRPLSLALHHRNGVPDDNRLENIALLCPNCHSQTDNFGSRNRRRRSEAA